MRVLALFFGLVSLLAVSGVGASEAYDEQGLIFSGLEVSDVAVLREHPFVLGAEGVDVVRAGFRQEKSIKALTRPLISSGIFLFSRPRGACWRTKKPFVNNVVITPHRLSQQNRSGEVQSIESTKHPKLKAMTDMFMAMLAMDPDKVFDLFSVSTKVGDGGWTIGLIPRDVEMRVAIEAIVLKGVGADLQLLMLFEQYGDRTVLRLSYGADRHDPLSAEEVGFFEPGL